MIIKKWTKLTYFLEIIFLVKSGLVNILMALLNQFKGLLNFKKQMKKMRSVVYKWTSMKLDTTSDINSQMEIRQFNIHVRYNNQ